MAFVGHSGSSRRAKGASPTRQSASMNNNPKKRSKNEKSGHAVGRGRISRKKVATVYPELETEDIDVRKPNCVGRLSYEKDSVRLSSDSKSPSFLSSNNSQDVWEFDCCNPSFHHRFSSVLSLSKSSKVLSDEDEGDIIFDSSRISALDEASLVHDKPCKIIQEGVLAEEGIIELNKPVESEFKDSAVGPSQNGNSGYCESLPTIICSCTSLSTCDIPSQDIGRTDILVSSLGLDNEVSKVIGDKKSERVEGGDLKEEEGRTQVNKSVKKELKDSFIGSSQNGNSSYENFLYEDSSVIGSSCTPLSIYSDMPSQNAVGTDKWVSSLDHESENTELAQDKPCECIEGGDFKEEGGTVQLNKPVGNELRCSACGSSMHGDSSYERSVFEDPSVVNKSCTSLSMRDDTPSQIVERTDIWVSPLDLESENSELIQCREQGSDIFDSGFPSPSFSILRNLQANSSYSCSIASTDLTEEVRCPPEHPDSDEPLFWPFDHKSYQSPEFEKFLALSPRKDERDVGVLGLNGLKPIRSRPQRNNPPAGRNGIQGCKKKILSSPITPKSPAAEHKTRSAENDSRKTSVVPSRLHKLTKASSEQNPPSKSKKRRRPQLKIDVPKHGGSLSQPLQELEAGNVRNLAVEGVPIEELVGLNEFDGQEGIGAEFDKDQFILCGSPYKSARMMSLGDVG